MKTGNRSEPVKLNSPDRTFETGDLDLHKAVEQSETFKSGRITCTGAENAGTGTEITPPKGAAEERVFPEVTDLNVARYLTARL
ncbi:MAG: hypothetical protein LBJ01_05635 [Tannerella sp.]|nr:hypothetical protein [Tannerella sp.]